MDKETIDHIEAAISRRKPLRKITNALRLVNGLGDGLPGFVLEQYDDRCVIHLFDTRWIARKETLAEYVASRLGASYLIIKERLDPQALTSERINASVWLDQAPSRTAVRENDLSFGVDLNDGLNSGLFLDMRRNRKIVAGLTKGIRVLNCFAYTCSFGVYARAFGASSVINVDISRKSLERGRENYELNRLEWAENEFVRADALTYMKLALKKGNRFECVILDPPSFARHDRKIFSVKKDFPVLIDAAMKVLEPGGVLLAATNFSGLSHRVLEEMVAASHGERVKSLKPLGQDRDFRGSGRMPESYLAALLIKTR
ncbi:MAG TPA: class I SAM-dependent methyltransferase [Syntrophales bacterium]|nr:class I SAM-dependent methyltransferase [Syntrophales bacterium]HPQ43771.1 class I SAM-dependent methyltransferase [Syntrophales bacterium]